MKKSIGFTLAEILITLGIIGVIASITIPVLMQDIQDMQCKIAAKAAYSKASNAINLIKADNGTWDNQMSYIDFYTAFRSYFKTIDDVIGGDNYYRYIEATETSPVYNNISGSYPGHTWYMNFEFLTVDGMFWATSWWDDSSGLRFGITVDVNGYGKKPNVYGRDVFMFQVINGSLLPMGAAVTELPANVFCNKETPGSSSGLGCMYNVMNNINY